MEPGTLTWDFDLDLGGFGVGAGLGFGFVFGLGFGLQPRTCTGPGNFELGNVVLGSWVPDLKR